MDDAEDGLITSRAHGVWVLVATILGSAMVFIDGSAVSVAIPVIQAELGATVNEIQWIVEAYMLFLASLLLVGGVLGDRFGRKRLFVIGLGIFTVASVACGFAASALQLILSRAVQGVGAALLTPGSLAIISASFPSAERGRAIGTWAAFSGLTAALGPVLGGVLTDFVSWRAIFFINVPVALVVLAASARVPESRDEEREPGIDLAGATTATLGLGGVIFALVEGPLRGWRDPLIAAAVGVGLVSLILFFEIQARKRQPMVPLGIFRQRTFSASNALTLLVYGALGGALFFLPLNLIQVQGYSATFAGAAILPFIVLLTLFSRFTGGLADRFGPRRPMAYGAAITGLGYFLLTMPGVGTYYWTDWFPGILTMGVGMTLLVAPLTTAVMGSVRRRHSGLASGVNNAVSRAAQLLAVAAFGVVMVAVFTASLTAGLSASPLDEGEQAAVLAQRGSLGDLEPPEGLDAAERAHVERLVKESFVAAFRVTVVIAGGLCVLGGVIAAGWVERKEDFRSPDAPTVPSA